MRKDDDEDVSIIRSHAMREVRRRRRLGSETRNRKTCLTSSTPSSDVQLPVLTQEEESGSILGLDWCQAVAASTSLANAYTMVPTIDERAEGFFFANYVMGMDSPATGYSVWGPGVDQVVLSSMNAVGLASLANHAHVPDLMREAKKRYLTAIRLTNTALRSAVSVKKDSTLLAIMILSLYEAVGGDEPRSLTAWKDHLHGAAALLKLRGPEQLNNSGGRRMFMQVMANLVTSCLLHEIELPDHITDLRAEAARYLQPNSLVLPYQDAMVLFTNFRALVRRGIICEPHIILRRALELDDTFASMFSDVPPLWEYQTVYTDADPDIVFSGYYHVYPDFLAAQMWNGMRVFRTMLNQMVRKTMLAHFLSEPTQSFSQEYVAQYRKSSQVLYQMQLDILASVPQHLGYTLTLSSRMSAQSSSTSDWSAHKLLWSGFNHHRHWDSEGPESTANLPVVRLSGCHSLPWPLYLAAITDIATERDRRWVINILRSIGHSMGFQQAMVLASRLETKMNGGVFQSEQEGRHYEPGFIPELRQVQASS